MNINHSLRLNQLNFMKISLLLVFTIIALLSRAIEKETIVRLDNEQRILSTTYELHLTSTDSAMINSTVSLNHEDAWLFFDNIRPAEVIATYTSSIRINGEVYSSTNGRIAMYGHGTVIMPYGYSFKPLTVYTEENFGGNSTQLSIQTYHNALGDFDNSIKSFKLKRGYMATLANNADGSGYSRVFIADTKDLEIDVMKEELYGTVSFIRVFKHEWVSKKGWAGWNSDEINKANVTCYYDWNVGGTTTLNYEYTPIRQNGGWPSWSAINEKQNVTHLLGFNEPDRPDQANMQFQDMIDQWPEMMKSGLRIGSPAWSNPWGGKGGNLFDFINTCDELNYRVDFVALHCYWGGKSPQNWYNDLKYIHEQTGRPLWITEWNNGANWTNEWWPDGRGYNEANAQKQLNDLKGILQVLDTASFIERYFIYNWVEDCRAIILNGELTLAGEYYAENHSQIAYNNQNEVVPHWNYLEPELSARYFSLSNSMRVSWTNANGELSRKFILEKKINDGDYEAIYSTDDSSVEFYLDPLDQELYGTISYRLKLQTAQGDFLTSNVVSYYQFTGENEIQSGNFNITSLEINTAYFTKRYSSKPLMILGIPSFNNPVPMTQFVNSVSTTTANFLFYPWSYYSNPQITKPELLASLAIPADKYNFEGLKSEANTIAVVKRDWIPVTFSETFEQAPAVFCTLGSRKNFYPLTVAIRNVTTTGFEIRLKSEEAITATLNAETVNYLAIEPGKGVIDSKRITVGRNYGGNGISSTPLEIPYDSSYTEPAIFAGLLSDEDVFASTLRYSITGESNFKLIKNRELSGGESEIKADDFGWMVMDLSADQPDLGTTVIEQNRTERISFYPNPAQHTIYFETDKPIQVEILDLSGNILLKSFVSQSLDVGSLSTGFYIIKVSGKLAGKLILEK